jgi:hypothetical protein
MKPYLEGGFLTGLIAALGHDYMYAVRRYISNKGSYAELTAKIFLPTEVEVYGMQINGDELGDTAADTQYVNPIQLPIYRDSYKHRVKRYNGSRQWRRLATALAGSASSFCNVNNNGNANNNNASGVGGCAPDSASHAKCRAFSPTRPTWKEGASFRPVSPFTARAVTIRLDASGRTLLAWRAYCVTPVSCPAALRGIRGKRGQGEESPPDAAQGFLKIRAGGI